jgi:hypothetical protein
LDEAPKIDLVVMLQLMRPPLREGDDGEEEACKPVTLSGQYTDTRPESGDEDAEGSVSPSCSTLLVSSSFSDGVPNNRTGLMMENGDEEEGIFCSESLGVCNGVTVSLKGAAASPEVSPTVMACLLTRS